MRSNDPEKLKNLTEVVKGSTSGFESIPRNDLPQDILAEINKYEIHTASFGTKGFKVVHCFKQENKEDTIFKIEGNLPLQNREGITTKSNNKITIEITKNKDGTITSKLHFD